MRKLKRVAAITLLAVGMGLTVPQAFAGDMQTPGWSDGTAESPGVRADGPSESPGLTSLIMYYLEGVLISG